MAPKKRGKKKVSTGEYEMPEGLRVLWNFSCFMVFFFLLIFFLSDFAVVFGFVLEGVWANLFHLIYFVIFLTIVFGITFHRSWVKDLMLWAFYYWTANIFVTFLFSPTIQQPFIKNYMLVAAPVMLFFVVMNLMIIWYLFEKKDCFVSGKCRNDSVDWVFKYLAVFFYLGLIILMLFGTVKTGQVYLAKSQVYEFHDILGRSDVFAGCDDGDSSCMILKAQYHSDEAVCLGIDDAYYRLLCYFMVE